MKFNFKKLSLISLATLLFSTPLLNNNANAQSKNKYPKEKVYLSKTLTNKLAKDGYVYRLYTTKDTKNPDYPYVSVPSKNKTNFKVKAVWILSGATGSEGVELVSRKGKVVNADFIDGFYNNNKNIKSLRNIVKLETKIMNTNKKHNKDLSKLRKMINHVKLSKDRKIALESYHQLVNYLKNNKNGAPSLLIGENVF
ncbi:hypothetical protein [Apilactobacillus quenuiae]|uniref:hypothetical protein n=1 Tax=Apilactobacillus quenuiae TaxID=2008377 RepID=UPI000D0120D6|nr:hypothetical protein [Apilactobacillus quenuiae]